MITLTQVVKNVSEDLVYRFHFDTEFTSAILEYGWVEYNHNVYYSEDNPNCDFVNIKVEVYVGVVKDKYQPLTNQNKRIFMSDVIHKKYDFSISNDNNLSSNENTGYFDWLDPLDIILDHLEDDIFEKISYRYDNYNYPTESDKYLSTENKIMYMYTFEILDYDYDDRGITDIEQSLRIESGIERESDYTNNESRTQIFLLVLMDLTQHD